MIRGLPGGEQHGAAEKNAARRLRQPVAIVGMSCLFPGASDPRHFFNNIIGSVDSIREAGAGEADLQRLFRSAGQSFEHIYSKQGGFITELAEFDPLAFGIMPNSVAGGDPDQFLALKIAAAALKDAGYAGRPQLLERAEIILGRTSAPGVGALNLIQHGHTVEQIIAVLRVLHSEHSEDELSAIAADLHGSLRQCNADTIPAVMPNVLAGRIAGRLGFGGKSLILDAACASSLVAVETAVADLLSGVADFALAGGLHINSCAFFYQLFCGLGALSRAGAIRPFDQGADGTILGEGIGIVALKRLSDAIADKDRIYATVLSVGSSSDGRSGSLLAPSVEGECLSMRRAYEIAGVSPRTIGLLEAHGTGTPAGDLAELQAIAEVFSDLSLGQKDSQGSLPDTPWCALGSVKSMIGHTQAASGIAGLIKAALALYHKVLPPTLNVTHANQKIHWPSHPCYLNTTTRPWIHPDREDRQPRRAAVSAFGFGGVNAHAVLEEVPESLTPPAHSVFFDFDSEVLVFADRTKDGLLEQISRLRRFCAGHPEAALSDIAYTVNCCRNDKPGTAHNTCRLAIVAGGLADLELKLKAAAALLSSPDAVVADGSQTGIYFTASGKAIGGKLAFLFPGLGSAYPNMLFDLCLRFPEMRQVFDYVDSVALAAGESVLPSTMLFPQQGSFSQSPAAGDLATMDSAVIAVLMAEYALNRLLTSLEIRPDALMGVSTGEFAALTIGGAVDVEKTVGTIYKLSVGVARSLPADSLSALCSISVFAALPAVAPLLNSLNEPVYLSGNLGPRHVLLTGSKTAMEAACALLKDNNFPFHCLPVAIPYHTPLVEAVVDAEQQEVRALELTAPETPIWSCSMANICPDDEDSLRQMITELFARPVMLKETVEAMYASGARIFVEVGPKSGLTALVKEILGQLPAVCVASNLAGRSGVASINHMLAMLSVHGVGMNLKYLYKRRSPLVLDLESLPAAPEKKTLLPLSFPQIKLAQIPGCPVAALQEKHSPEGSRVASRQEVLAGYLNSTAAFHEQMMQVQQQVHTAFLHATASRKNAWRQDSAMGAMATLPFLRRASISRGSDSLQSSLTLSLEEDLYLLDHAIGGKLGALESQAVRVHLLPLMVALEIMAETAWLFAPSPAPQYLVSKISSVRAYSRIKVANTACPLIVTARLINAPAPQVAVSVELRADCSADEAAQTKPSMSCEVTFVPAGHRQAGTTTAGQFAGRAPHLTPERLYGQGSMFHGPSMQSVRSLTKVGTRSISGTVAGRLAERWFAGGAEAAGSDLLIHPLLLDNASQLVLYYLFEENLPVTALLPFHIESIDFHEYSSPLPADLSVEALLHNVSERGTEASLKVSDRDGQLFVSINNISSKGIALSSQWAEFVRDPLGTIIGSPLNVTEGLFEQDAAEMIKADEALIPVDAATMDWCADYLLTANERRIYESLSRSDKRRRQWLLGRIAAKDAVRSLIARQFGTRLGPADLEIAAGKDGRPFVSGALAESSSPVPELSITHSGSTAIALAVFTRNGTPVGVDAETVRKRDDGFEELVFSLQERQQLQGLEGAERDLETTRLWCAREAAAKALGTALPGALRSCRVEQFDRRTGRLLVLPTSPQAYSGQADCPEPEGGAICVQSLLLDDMVLAFTVAR